MNHLGLWGRAAAVTMVLFGLLGLASCDKISNDSEHLDDEYVGISSWVDDWSGDYIIAHKDGSSLIPLSGVGDKGEGAAGEKLSTLDGVVFGSDADNTKAVLIKSGEYYRVHIESVGYIGFDGENGFIKSAKELNADCYLWEVLYSDNGEGDFSLNPKAGDGAIAWNSEEKCFYISSSAKSALLYKRVVGTGIQNKADTDNPGTEPDPDKPNPEPGPTPEPVPTNGKYGWFELPAVNYEVSGTDLIDKDDKTLYFAHHFCAGGEKGPGGKTARNFSVCYSSKHLCPVWVAGPRHKMYTGQGRHDNYKRDPKISCPQNGKWPGYTRGHMIGSSDRNHSVATNHQVFYYSNIAPQVQSGFNTGGGAWNNLEDHIDGLVCSDTLYAVVGCYFETFTDKYNQTITPKKASGGDVPTMFYYALLRTKNGNTGKAVTSCSASELQCVAFVLSHTGNHQHKPQVKDMMSVSDLEKLTGFSYFPNVPNAPKSTFTPSDWL